VQTSYILIILIPSELLKMLCIIYDLLACMLGFMNAIAYVISRQIDTIFHLSLCYQKIMLAPAANASVPSSKCTFVVIGPTKLRNVLNESS